MEKGPKMSAVQMREALLSKYPDRYYILIEYHVTVYQCRYGQNVSGQQRRWSLDGPAASRHGVELFRLSSAAGGGQLHSQAKGWMRVAPYRYGID